MVDFIVLAWDIILSLLWLWFISNHGTQDKPAVTAHTQGKATVMAACTICSAFTILSPNNK